MDPGDFAAAVKQILNVHFQVILRFDEGVMRIRKIEQCFSRPGTSVGTDVHNVVRLKTQARERNEETLQPVIRGARTSLNEIRVSHQTQAKFLQR
jgi:hypothetical protein